MPTRPTGADADLFQALVENSSDVIVLLDDRGVVRFISRSVERVLGYTPAERLGKSAFELVHDDERPAAREALARCITTAGTSYHGELRIRHKDGSWRLVEAIASNRLLEPAVGGIVVNYRDITGRRQAEEALRAGEERLRHLFETAPDLIYYCSPEGRFTYVNPAAVRVMKYDEGELLGRHFLTLVDPRYQAQAAEFYTRQVAELRPNTYFEFPAVTKTGQQLWMGQHVQLIVEGGMVAGVQAIARDITSQKDAEERLRRSEARHRSLVNGAEYAIFRTSLDGSILDGNPAFVSMLGYDSIDQLRRLNMTTDVYTSESGRAAMLERFHREGKRRLSGSVKWRRKDGSEITVRLSGRLVDFEDDGVSGFEAIAEDITARRALEGRLRQSQKMEAVGRLARGIAHDFNNLLAAIMGCADLMQAELDPKHPSYVDAVEIGRAAERGASLTRQLMAFSRRQTLSPEPLDVHAVIRGFERMLQQLAGGVDIRVHTPGPPPIVRAEPGHIEQVVMNLVVNAREATTEGGTIDVSADIVQVRGRDAAKYADVPPGAYARITVQDTGIGIEPEVHRHVFDPFYSTKDPAAGGGLGLSIVYGIARDAGGTVTFTSTPGHGTTFEVLLPLLS